MEPSAAQNGPVIKTCTQCGAIQQAQTNVCTFCDAPLTATEGVSRSASHSGAPTRGNLALDPDWKRELASRVDAYRTRRKRSHAAADQGALPFESSIEQEELSSRDRRACPGGLGDGENDPAEAAEEFAFAVGIGRKPASSPSAAEESAFRRVEIDVTQPAAVLSDEAAGSANPAQRPPVRTDAPYFPVASLPERCLAGAFDTVFLLFAYGGFLTLFGSLGGHFSFSKFSVAVYAVSLGLFYLQYFALFTIFGGATPGMMLRRLQVVSFDGDAPSSGQLLQRSFGYVVAGGTFLLGFFWSLWDECHLTWQDRISRTHLVKLSAVFAADPLGEPEEAQSAAHK